MLNVLKLNGAKIKRSWTSFFDLIGKIPVIVISDQCLDYALSLELGMLNKMHPFFMKIFRQ